MLLRNNKVQKERTRCEKKRLIDYYGLMIITLEAGASNLQIDDRLPMDCTVDHLGLDIEDVVSV